MFEGVYPTANLEIARDDWITDIDFTQKSTIKKNNHLITKNKHRFSLKKEVKTTETLDNKHFYCLKREISKQ